MHFVTNIAVEQEVIGAAITIALIPYLHASDVHHPRIYCGAGTRENGVPTPFFMSLNLF